MGDVKVNLGKSVWNIRQDENGDSRESKMEIWLSSFVSQVFLDVFLFLLWRLRSGRAVEI